MVYIYCRPGKRQEESTRRDEILTWASCHESIHLLYLYFWRVWVACDTLAQQRKKYLKKNDNIIQQRSTLKIPSGQRKKKNGYYLFYQFINENEKYCWQCLCNTLCIKNSSEKHEKNKITYVTAEKKKNWKKKTHLDFELVNTQINNMHFYHLFFYGIFRFLYSDHRQSMVVHQKKKARHSIKTR